MNPFLILAYGIAPARCFLYTDIYVGMALSLLFLGSAGVIAYGLSRIRNPKLLLRVFAIVISIVLLIIGLLIVFFTQMDAENCSNTGIVSLIIRTLILVSVIVVDLYLLKSDFTPKKQEQKQTGVIQNTHAYQSSPITKD